MLYSRTTLKTKNFAVHHKAMERYLHKFMNDEKNFDRLKWHEKDFFFEHLQILRDDNGKKKFNLLKIPKAADYLFEKIILLYAGGSKEIDFSRITSDYDGVIDKKRQDLYQTFFWKRLSIWRNEMESRKGSYASVICPMRNQKRKELDNLYGKKIINKAEYIKRENRIDVTFYHIYYKARCYFDELKDNSEKTNVCDFDFYADIYTYCHVLSRHYFPQMNIGIGGTLNDNIPYVDVFELPKSLLQLIVDYSKFGTITKETEYLLFQMDGSQYILWVKYGKIPSLNNKEGFEIRSFYKCIEKRDLDKGLGLSKHKIKDGLYVIV